jgi:uncharacterized protein (DUF2062 family)
MIFKRREKLSLIQKIRYALWPKCGIKRSLIYIKYRLIRLPHSSHHIALGLASGCVVSWTPTFPFQILQCYIFCKMTRANFFAGMLGTLFGNPWTFPLLFSVAYMVGKFFLDITGLENLFVFLAGEWVFLNENGFGLTKFMPTLIGGYIMAILTFPIFYYAFYYFLRAGRAAQKRVGKTAHVLAEKVHDIKEHRHEKKEERERHKKD